MFTFYNNTFNIRLVKLNSIIIYKFYNMSLLMDTFAKFNYSRVDSFLFKKLS